MGKQIDSYLGEVPLDLVGPMSHQTLLGDNQDETKVGGHLRFDERAASRAVKVLPSPAASQSSPPLYFEPAKQASLSTPYICHGFREVWRV